MRRSQMLNVIAETLVSYGVDLKDCEGLSYEILYEIEKFMHPKQRMLPLKYDNNGKQLQAEYTNTWEQE